MEFIGPLYVVTFFVNSHLKVWPINESNLINVKSEFLRLLFCNIWMNVNPWNSDNLSLRVFNHFFDNLNERFLGHLIRIDTKYIITGCLLREKIRSCFECIKWSFKNINTVLEIF